MKDAAYQKLMDYSLRAISRRAHSTHEIREKLKKRPHHTQAHEDRIISRLIELNMLNDTDYIRRTIEYCTQLRGYGYFKIAQRLQQKGLPTDEVKHIWDDMKIPEEKIAKEALKKIQKRLTRVDKQQRIQKRIQFLKSRGFASNIVFKLAKKDEIV